MIQRTFLIILMVMWPLGRAWATDWPQWRGPDRTDVSKETGLLEAWPPGGPKLLWTLRDAGNGYSCMSIVGDRLYSMGAEGNTEYVYAIDLNTRKKSWSTEVGARFTDSYNDGPRSTPTIDGNFLYALGSYGNLVCVETASGKKVWSQQLVKDLGGLRPRYGYCESPLVDGDQVVVTHGSKKGVLAALDKKTGTLKWRSTTLTNENLVKDLDKYLKDVDNYSSMIVIEVGGVRQYVQIPGRGRCVVGVKASDGKLLWKFALETPPEVITTPIYRNDCVYISYAYSCHLRKLVPDGDKFKAEPIYISREMQNGIGGVLLVGEYLYGYTGEHGGWMCQNFKTGKAVWKKRSGRGEGSVTFADGNLYCYHASGEVRLIKATPVGYKEQGKFRIPEGSKWRRGKPWLFTRPIVANGRLYLRDQDLIFCYDIRKPQ